MVSRGTIENIAAIATPVGRGGIGVVRLSGAGLDSLLRSLIGSVPPPRVAIRTRFNDERGGVIDDGLVLYFPAPNSYTGEDVVELHGHGGPSVMARLLKRCLALGCRIAHPGEFTERAFLSGKLDLAQAESVADLIEASTEQAAQSAARTLTGEFSTLANNLIAGIKELRAHVEACIDFPEEEIDPADLATQRRKLVDISKQLDEIALRAAQGAVLRDGLTVVLIGRPNVGKSSLLNRLAGEDVAIVTPIAGTTRDHVRVTIHLAGVPVHLIDTAGLRATDDPIERIGIERTWAAIERAGAALLIAEAGEMAGLHEAEILNKLPPKLPIAWIYNKIDLYRPSGVPRETSTSGNNMTLFLSALTGEGVDALRAWLLEVAGWKPHGEGVFLARERHLHALRQAKTHLNSAMAIGDQYELFAEELRLGQVALSTITGEFTSDDLLGEIFSKFCIGK